MFPGAGDIFDERELVSVLATLIVTHTDINRWMLKV